MVLFNRLPFNSNLRTICTQKSHNTMNHIRFSAIKLILRSFSRPINRPTYWIYKKDGKKGNVEITEIIMNGIGRFSLLRRFCYRRLKQSQLTCICINLQELTFFTLTEPDVEEMQSSDKNIAVFPEQCASEKCSIEACGLPECELCRHCLSSEHMNELNTAYREHINRGDTKRIFLTPIKHQKPRNL